MKTIPRLRRIRRSPEVIQNLLAEYRACGISASKFAQTRQLPLSSLMNWLHRNKPAPSAAAPRWVEVHPQPAALSSVHQATVRCLDGVSIDLHPGFEPARIAELIRLLRQP